MTEGYKTPFSALWYKSLSPKVKNTDINTYFPHFENRITFYECKCENLLKKLTCFSSQIWNIDNICIGGF